MELKQSSLLILGNMSWIRRTILVLAECGPGASGSEATILEVDESRDQNAPASTERITNGAEPVSENCVISPLGEMSDKPLFWFNLK